MLTAESLKWALQRVEGFEQVNRNISFRDKIEAMTTMRESFGLTDDICEDFEDWVQRFAGEGYEQPMLLGLLIGTIAAEHDHWL